MAPHLRQQGLQPGPLAPIKGLPNVQHGLIGRRQSGGLNRGSRLRADANADRQGCPQEHVRQEVR